MKLRRPTTVAFVVSCLLSFIGASGGRAQGWYPVNTGTKLEFTGVAFTNAMNGTIIAFDSTILRTTNGGSSWFHEKNSVPGLNGVCFPDALHGWVASEECVIIKTTDGGVSWSQPTTPGYQHVTAVSCIDSNTGIVVGDTTIYYFAFDPSLGDIGFEKHTPVYPSAVALAHHRGIIGGLIYGNIEAILLSSNNGNSWALLDESVVSTVANVHKVFAGVAVLDTNTAIAVGSDGVILQASFAGRVIGRVVVDSPVGWSAVSFPDSKHGTAVGGGGHIIHTTDGGYHWKEQQSGITQDLNAVYFLDANNGWAVGPNGTVLHTTTGGESSSNGVQSTPQNSSADLPMDLLNPRSIDYDLPFDADIRIEMIDPSGREQRTLIAEHEASGHHRLSSDWNALPNGLYFCNLRAVAANGNVLSRMWKILLMH